MGFLSYVPDEIQAAVVSAGAEIVVEELHRLQRWVELHVGPEFARWCGPSFEEYTERQRADDVTRPEPRTGIAR